jgi:integrase
MAIATITSKVQMAAAPVGVTWQPDIPGLLLRVRPSGRRAWALDYWFAGRHRLITIGDVPPEAARKIAEKHRVAIAHGRDPLAEKDFARKATEAAVTLSTFFERYLSDYASGAKKPRSVAEDARLFHYTIEPKLGRVRVPDLDDDAVRAFHQGLRATPIVANRALALLSKMMNLAEAWGLRPKFSSPTRYVQKYPERKAHRFLSSEQLTSLGRTLAEIEKLPKGHADAELPSVIAAVRLLLFTGCRRGEVLGLKWDAVNLDANVLDLPDSKTGRKVIVLNAPARAVLDTLAKQRKAGAAYVIHGRWPHKPLVGLPHAWLRIRARAGLDGVRLHDLRHSYASTAAGLGASLPVIGALLGHTQPQTTARYAGLSVDPRREAAERVGERLDALLNPPEKPAAVVPLSGRRKKAARRG